MLYSASYYRMQCYNVCNNALCSNAALCDEKLLDVVESLYNALLHRGLPAYYEKPQ